MREGFIPETLRLIFRGLLCWWGKLALTLSLWVVRKLPTELNRK